MRTIIWISYIFLIISSCRTAVCESTGAYLNFNMLDSADMSAISVTEYERGTNFTQEIRHYIAGSTFPKTNGLDTLDFDEIFYLKKNIDKKITLLSSSKVYRVRDFDFVQTKRKEFAFGAGEIDPCSNDAQVYVNDTLYHGNGNNLDLMIVTINVPR